MFCKKEFEVVSNLRFIAGQISCSAELSKKNVLKPWGQVYSRCNTGIRYFNAQMKKAYFVGLNIFYSKVSI